MKARALDVDTRGFVVVMDTGDEPVAALQEWAAAEDLGASSVSAIGAFQSVVLGYFDWQTKECRRIPVDDQVEVVSLLGDIADGPDGKKLHAHVVVAGADAVARAGHLMEAVVRPMLEVVVTELPAHLRRRHDAETGLALLAVE